MSLIDRLKTLELTEPSNTCAVARIQSQLDPDTADALRRVLESKVPTMKIYRELRSEGFKIARDSLSNHRNGLCKCGAER